MEYLLLFTILVALSNLYIKIAVRYQIVDNPNNRSSHVYQTVRGGGIIFPMTGLVWFVASGFQFPWVFSGLIFISIISFWDDISSVSHKIRLIIHLGSLLLLFTEIQLFQFPWFIWVPVIIVSAATINAFNFMDGINGITGGYALSVLIGIWIINNFQFKFISNQLIYYFMISLFVFSYFNFRTHAKFFAGDVGSIAVAYMIVFFLANLVKESGNWLYILFISAYGVDAGLTIVQRIIHKENIFAAHRKHLYQLLVNELKVSHLKVASIYAMVQLIICLTIYYIINTSKGTITYFITGAIIIAILIIAYIFIKTQIYKKVKILNPELQSV